jgi:hypothetical protein
MAGMQGLEPRSYDPESYVLPLDDIPTQWNYTREYFSCQPFFAPRPEIKAAYALAGP